MKNIIGTFVAIAITFFCSINSFTSFSTGFRDINGHWAKESIIELAGKGIIKGVGGGRFAPEEIISRAEFITMLVRALDVEAFESDYFSDTADHWSDVNVDTAVKNDIIDSTYSTGKFLPDAPILRGDMAEFIYRALKLEPSERLNPFEDLTISSVYAIKLYEVFILNGYLENGEILFRPNGMTKRAEAATIMCRIIHYRENSEKFKNEEQKKRDIQNKKIAEADSDFEAFTISADAENYMSSNLFYAKDGLIRWKENGAEIIASNDDNKMINVNAYNAIKTLVKSARENGDYVRAWYNRASEFININYFPNVIAGRGAATDGMFVIKLPLHPYLIENSKYKSCIGWNVLRLWENYTSPEEIIAGGFVEKNYVDIMIRGFKAVYGEKDGQTLADYALKYHKIIRQKQVDGYASEPDLEITRTDYINGIEVANTSRLGKIIFYTNLK